jgi:glycosyltransferase involved in cell wall biosynthesis
MRLIPKDLKVKLTLVGSGLEEKRIKKLISEYELEDKIEHIPFVPREEVFSILENSDVYLFASLKEACNLSLLESMAIGLPVVCLNWTGMALSTDDSCAIRLQPSDPVQMPKDMAAAIVKLTIDKELRHKMGDAGRERIKKFFNWQTKVEVINKAISES